MTSSPNMTSSDRNFCDVCIKQLGSRTAYRNHLASQVHLRNVKNPFAIAADDEIRNALQQLMQQKKLKLEEEAKIQAEREEQESRKRIITEKNLLEIRKHIPVDKILWIDDIVQLCYKYCLQGRYRLRDYARCKFSYIDENGDEQVDTKCTVVGGMIHGFIIDKLVDIAKYCRNKHLNEPYDGNLKLDYELPCTITNSELFCEALAKYLRDKVTKEYDGKMHLPTDEPEDDVLVCDPPTRYTRTREEQNEIDMEVIKSSKILHPTRTPWELFKEFYPETAAKLSWVDERLLRMLEAKDFPVLIAALFYNPICQSIPRKKVDDDEAYGSKQVMSRAEYEEEMFRIVNCVKSRNFDPQLREYIRGYESQTGIKVIKV